MTYRLLDLFCGAGGCSVGYHRAGFDVVGVDIEPHPDYPYDFILADATTFPLDGFDAYHASPPCPAFTRAGHLAVAQGRRRSTVNLIPQTRARLLSTGRPYIIENVPGAPLHGSLLLCGSSFGLRVRRHRIFESNVVLWGLPCNHERQGRPVGVYHVPGDEVPHGGRTAVDLADGQDAMGIDWMSRWADLKDAIPPAYTEFIGRQLVGHLDAERAA